MFDDTQPKTINRAVLVGLNAPGLSREENAGEESLAELVLVCRKRMSVPMEEERIPADVREKQYHGDYHEMYWGEIVEALKKV